METLQAFQEHTLEELNGVIISQQQQIDRLESQMVLLQKKLIELGGEPGEPGINGP